MTVFFDRRKAKLAATLRVEREQRESVSGRLRERVPGLASLSFAVYESRPGGYFDDVHYTRRTPLEHASALFEIRCSYAGCEGGGYDVTREVLRALDAGIEQFEGGQECPGSVGQGCCPRVLRYVGTATYVATERRASLPAEGPSVRFGR